jgi:hypothetical protein
MRARRLLIGAVTVAAFMGSAADATAQPDHSGTPSCGTPVANAQLNAVAAVSPTDAWTVGNYGDFNTTRTLIEHWNGAVWCKVASPNPGGGQHVLEAVAAASSSDVWAVGYSMAQAPHEHTLILHWDGIKWSTVPSPDPSRLYGNKLDGLTVISPKNAWAAGYYVSKRHAARNLLLHWNGQNWRTYPIQSSGPLNDGLNAMTATSRSNVIALGYQDDATYTAKPAVVRWNGRRWRTMSGPRLGGAREGGYLLAARAFSASNAWAVGNYATTATAQSLIEHWNGHRWTRVPHPNPSSGQNFGFLDGIAGTSPSDLWAAGCAQVNEIDQTLIEHWDGSAWTIVPSPDPAGPSVNNILMAAAATSSTDVWAVGFSSNGGASSQTLVLHWSGTAWTQIPSP